MSSVVVFDAEPVIANVLDEPGADTVDSYFADVRSEGISAWMCTVTLTEIHYIIGREVSREKADDVRDFLINIGFNFVDVGNIYLGASRFKREYSVALGDAMALATAEEAIETVDEEDEVSLLVGADDCYDNIEENTSEPRIVRFREESG